MYTTKIQEVVMPETKHKPGEIADKSGQYPLIGPRGGKTGEESTVTKGEPFPPRLKPNMGYDKPDPTKHKKSS